MNAGPLPSVCQSRLDEVIRRQPTQPIGVINGEVLRVFSHGLHLRGGCWESMDGCKVTVRKSNDCLG